MFIHFYVACTTFGLQCNTHGTWKSFYPHNKKKAENIENQQILLDLSQNWGHRANYYPQNGKGEWQSTSLPEPETTNGASTW